MLSKYEMIWKKWVAKIMKSLKGNCIAACLYDLESEKGRLLLIVKEDSLQALEPLAAGKNILAWHNMPHPLVLTPQYIEASLDSYPLEFLHIKTGYQLVEGSDTVLQNLQFDKKDVRLQMEREIKGKYLLTLQAYLENNHSTRRLINVLQISAEALLPSLKGLLYLCEVHTPITRLDIIEAAAENLHIDLKAYTKALSIRKHRLSKTELQAFFSEYLQALYQMTNAIDKWEIQCIRLP